jgi:hypothetical protein
MNFGWEIPFGTSDGDRMRRFARIGRRSFRVASRGSSSPEPGTRYAFYWNCVDADAAHKPGDVRNGVARVI